MFLGFFTQGLGCWGFSVLEGLGVLEGFQGFGGFGDLCKDLGLKKPSLKDSLEFRGSRVLGLGLRVLGFKGLGLRV